MRLLAQDAKRNDQKKERGSRETLAASSSQAAAPATHELMETRIEADPNPKKRFLMRSASTPASGSGQRQVQRPATDAKDETAN